MESGQQTQNAPAAGLDELRVGLHTMWGAVAPGWRDNADFVDRRTEGLTRAMLEAASLKSGDQVLELACGPGGLGIAAAEKVAPDGTVVLSDVAPQMTAIAADRARQRGLGNTSTRELDLEAVDEADESFDAVLCREALMLVPEPARAAGEIHRVLRPGGRAVVSVWGSREQNPWLTAMLGAIGAQLGGTFPPPGVPGPLSLGEPGALLTALSEGGFADVGVVEVETPWSGASFDEWWQRTIALAGPVSKLLEAQPQDAVDAIRAHAHDALSEYETEDGLEIPGKTLLGTARRS